MHHLPEPWAASGKTKNKSSPWSHWGVTYRNGSVKVSFIIWAPTFPSLEVPSVGFSIKLHMEVNTWSRKKETRHWKQSSLRGADTHWAETNTSEVSVCLQEPCPLLKGKPLATSWKPVFLSVSARPRSHHPGGIL